MALTPERIAELERLKAMMRQPATDAQRKAQAILNAEKGAGQPVKLPTDKADGGSMDLDAMRLALMNKGGKTDVRHTVKLGDRDLPITMDTWEKRAGNKIVHVNPETFDKAFKKSSWQYVGPQGEGGIKDRYNNFADYAKSAKSAHASNADVNKDGVVTFGDGRHRYAYMRDQGLKSIPMSMDKQSIEHARRHGYLHEAKGGSVKDEPKNTVKAYKMFRADPKRPGQLFPLFVDADTPVPMGKWVDAIEGSMANGKVKSKIGPLAYRPGWHAGDLPLATHIGDKDEEQKAEVARIQKLRQAMLDDIGNDKEGKKIVNKMYPYPSWVNAPRLRNPRHIWAEIEMPNDVDWQTEAQKRGINDEGKFIANRAHITDQLPKGGHYRYKTNANMTGNWLIGGAMKVNKILKDSEVQAINEAAGVADLPRAKPMDHSKFGFDKGGSVNRSAPDEWVAEEMVNYRDPKSTKIADWKWRKMKDVRKDMPITEIPDYIQRGYGEFMNEQSKRAEAGELSPRDLLKAFTITQSSIGRGGLPHSTATKTGMKLPNTGGEVRPEGAFAEWLGSPMGQRFLDMAVRGEIDPKVLRDIQEKFSPFGKQNQLTDQMTYAAQNMPEMAKRMNKAVTGSTDEYRDWAEQMKGVAGAKSGFVGSMIGRGDLPTLDARQLNLHSLPANVGIGSIMNRGKGKGAREAVDRLAARQKAMNLKIDPSLAQHYQHLAHHAVWDKVGDNKTTHDDIIKAMRGYAEGGVTHAHHLDIEERPL